MGYQKRRNTQSSRYARKQARKGLKTSHKALHEEGRTLAIHKPATAKQKELLKKLGVPFDTKTSSRDLASKLIAKALKDGVEPIKRGRKRKLSVEEQVELVKKIMKSDLD